MKDNLVRDLMKRYISYFDLITMTDPEVKKQIFKWIDRDIRWFYKQERLPEQLPRKVKMIHDWKGTAGQLKQILAVGDKII